MKYVIPHRICAQELIYSLSSSSIFVFHKQNGMPVGPDSPNIFAALQWSSNIFMMVRSSSFAFTECLMQVSY
jgi:hypothetical protein